VSALGQGIVPVTLEEVQQELLRAIKAAAVNGSTANDSREMDEAAKAAKNFADAYVVLDPAVDGTGVPLQHQVQLEQLRQEGAQRLEEAKSRQSAPETKKRRVSIRRDQHGRATGYEESTA
jgi:hypothetical protein